MSLQRVRRERDVGRGGLAEGLIVITLICLLHIPALSIGDIAAWYARIALLNHSIGFINRYIETNTNFFSLSMLNDVYCQ